MTIRYALVRSETMVGNDRMVARVYSAGTVDHEEFIRRSSAAGTTVSISDTRAVDANQEQTLVSALADGFNVTTALRTFSIQIQGTFNGYEDRFDPNRHRIVIRFRPASRVLKDLRNRVRAQKIAPHELRPLLVYFRDVVSGQRDKIMTPGGIGHIFGSRLKFDPRDPEQGLFILNENRGVLRVQFIAENLPHKLMFLIPPLPAGTYRLAVRAACCGGESLETGFLGHPLAVVGAAPQLEAGDDFVPAGPFLMNP